MEDVVRAPHAPRLVTAVVALAFVLPGFVGIFEGIDWLRSDAQSVALGAAALGGGVVWLVLGLVVQWLATGTVEVDGLGVRQISRKGELRRSMRWDEPHDLYCRRLRSRRKGAVVSTALIFRPYAGRAIRIDGRHEGTEAQHAAWRASTEVVFARLWPRLQGGERVAFGPIELGPEGLRLKGQTHPLPSIRGVSFVRVENSAFERMSIAVEGRKKPLLVRSGKVANYSVLLRALERLRPGPAAL